MKRAVGIYPDREIDRRLEYFSYKLEAKKSYLVELALKLLFTVLEDGAECVFTSKTDLEQELLELKSKLPEEVEFEVV